MTFLYFFSIIVFLFIAFFLCVMVLIQEGKGGGLGASFGGGDTSDSLFGTSTPDILKKVTSWFAIAFVTMCIILSFWTASLNRHHMRYQSTPETTEIAE